MSNNPKSQEETTNPCVGKCPQCHKYRELIPENTIAGCILCQECHDHLWEELYEMEDN